MSDSPGWSEGYDAATRYFDTAIVEICPAAIDLCLLAAGRRPPREGGAFRYAELGCGTAFTLIGLAALHPDATFLGVDFMPEHVARARALIDEAGLDNIEVREASFADLTARAVPEEGFDYIAAHGVWTWVSLANRSHLATLFGQWLRPGGVAYIGYAAAAGWAEALALRQIMRETPRAPGPEPFANARAAAADWATHFATPHGTTLWEHIEPLPDRYLDHDFGARHAEPIWWSDLCADLAPAKLGFLCSAVLHDQFDALRFRGAALDFVRRGAAEGWGELARDIAAQRSFRADLFGRGTPTLTAAEQARRLGALRIAPWPPRLARERRRAEASTLRQFDEETQTRVADAFAAGQCNQSGQGDLPIHSFIRALEMPPKQALQTALIALTRGEAQVVRDPSVSDRTDDPPQRLAQALSRMWQDGASIPGAAAPRTGHVVPLSEEEQRALHGDAAPSTEQHDGFTRLGLI